MIKNLLISIIKMYQKISSLTPPTCRFYPTCSEYMKQAVSEWGVMKGVWLGVKRICRCHPLNEGGFDPPPLKGNKWQTK